MTSKEQCGDDRFEIINETKEYIINATNIDTSPEEMAVLDSVCYRLWQLGLTKRNKDKLKELTHQPTLSECVKEWEDRGWKVDELKQFPVIKIWKLNKEQRVVDNIYVFNKTLKSKIDFDADYETLNLLTKTLKAVEAENENNRKN